MSQFGSEVDFELNYFLTLEGGVKWAGILPSPYLEKFETSVDGHFDLSADVEFGFEKKWSLEDKLSEIFLQIMNAKGWAL